MNKEISKKQASLWLAAALIAPLAHGAASASWVTVAATGSLCLLLTWWITLYAVPGESWLEWIQCLWSAVVVSEFLHWSTGYWKGYEAGTWLPLILLALAVWSAKQTQGAWGVGCILLWPVLLLLGGVLLSAAPEVEVGNLTASWQISEGNLITIFLIPCMAAGRNRKPDTRTLWWLIALAALTSIVAAGVLSQEISAEMEAALYELSRSLSLLGIAERFESLVAAAMTLGLFASCAYLLHLPRDTDSREGKLWTAAAAAGLLYISGSRLDSRLMAVGSILGWVILPLLASLKKYFKKR